MQLLCVFAVESNRHTQQNFLNYNKFVINGWLLKKYVILLHKKQKYNTKNLMAVEEIRQEDVTINETSKMYEKIFEWTV